MSKYLRFGKKKDRHQTTASPTLLGAQSASHISQRPEDHSLGATRGQHSSIYEPDKSSLLSYNSSEESPQQTESETESWEDLKPDISGPFQNARTTMILGSKSENAGTERKSSETAEIENRHAGSPRGDELKLTISMLRELGLNLAHPNVFKTVVISVCIYHFPEFVFKGFLWLFILCLLHEPLRKPVREAVVTGFVGFLAVVNGFAVTLIQSIRVSMQQLRQRAEERPK